MFIEHRTYTIKPGHVATYLEDYGKNGWAVHSAHTPCVGHYYTEAGDLFRVISMWRYASFEERLAKRALLNADPGWRDVMSRISTVVTDIRSNLIMPSPCFVSDAWYKRLYDDIDNMRMDGFLAGLTDDVRLTFANHPSAEGKAQVRAAIGAFWASIKAMKHNFVNVFQDGDDLTLEARIDYTRKDGKRVTIPCVTLVKRRGERASEMRIYMDTAPIYAA